MTEKLIACGACCVALLVCSCVAPESEEEMAGVTGNIEEFQLRYEGLSPDYFDTVVNLEKTLARGRSLHDYYFKRKEKTKAPDVQTRMRAEEILMGVAQAAMRLRTEAHADSVLYLQREASSLLQDLLRERELPTGETEPGKAQ
jgi:hypothetical protein